MEHARTFKSIYKLHVISKRKRVEQSMTLEQLLILFL